MLRKEKKTDEQQWKPSKKEKEKNKQINII